MDVQPLTSERLPTLPKLDKNQFIHSYIQGQRAHAKSYAEEGQTLASSWDIHSTPNKPSAAVSNGPHNVGFSTPILTARIPRASEEGPKKEMVPSKSVDNQSARANKTQPKPKAKKNPEKTIRIQNSLSKNLDVDADSEDHAARLLERRERKRIKRAIVRPKDSSDPDPASPQDNAKSKKQAKTKGKKTKNPAGFALMHGFTATNVGKNRLTLKPPSNVGVFKKGKASFKTKIKQKLKGRQNKPFSEFGFLNATQKTPEQAVSESSSTSSSDSSATQAEEINEHPKKKAVSQKSRQAKSFHSLTQSSQPASVVAAPQKRSRVESEIWDIESRASEKRKSKIQKMCSVNEAGASYIQGTVVMDARIPAWCDRLDTATRDSVVEVTRNTVGVPDAIVIPSSPSLRPSQSASQVGQLVKKPGPAEEASRYFSVQQAVNSPIKPISYPDRDPEPVEAHQHIPPPTEPSDSVDLDRPPLPTTRFVVPSRNRAFAKHFLSVQNARSQSQDPYFYSCDAVVTESVLEQIHYACPPATEHDPDEFTLRYSATDGPLHSALGEAQLSNYADQSSADWDTHAVNRVLDTWDGPCDDEELDEFTVHDNPVEHPEYVDLVGDGDGDGDYVGCLEEDWQVDAEFKVGVYCENDAFMDEVGASDSKACVEAWEDAAANSVYWDESCDDGHQSMVWDDTNDFMEAAQNGQRSIDSSPQYSVISCDSEDVVVDCGISAYHPRFAQGRALLLGFPIHKDRDGELCVPVPPHFSHAELDVVRSLRGHWLPQRL
ncbi:hypothetical protein FB451DRAFT_1203845 [Mycena latifolia]|nr:hypothetical protein FB451DRAFT_1203845 [Mycena latifolia]